MSNKKRHPFIVIGSIGLVITAVLNLFNYFVLNVGGDAWWSVWFPLFAVWFTFLTIGLGMTYQDRGKSVEQKS